MPARINVPETLRFAVYIIGALGVPLINYLRAKGVIGDLEVGLWHDEMAAALAMAALNIIRKPSSTSGSSPDPGAEFDSTSPVTWTTPTSMAATDTSAPAADVPVEPAPAPAAQVPADPATEQAPAPSA